MFNRFNIDVEVFFCLSYVSFLFQKKTTTIFECYTHFAKVQVSFVCIFLDFAEKKNNLQSIVNFLFF